MEELVWPDDYIAAKNRTRIGICSVRLYFLKYDKAVEWIKSNKERFSVNSFERYMELGRDGVPLFLPMHPHIVYKDNGWISWGHFLGTGNPHKKTMYKNQTEDDIIEKSKVFCSLYEKEPKDYLLPIYEYLKHGNYESLYNIFQKNHSEIKKVCHSLIKRDNLPRPRGSELIDSINDSFFVILDVLKEGRYLPEKLYTRHPPLYSWMATFCYTLYRENNKIKKVEINPISESFSTNLHHIDDFEEFESLILD